MQFASKDADTWCVVIVESSATAECTLPEAELEGSPTDRARSGWAQCFDTAEDACATLIFLT
jgi:hypothetical protein